MELNEVYFWTSTIVIWKHLLKPDKYKEVILQSLKNLVQRKLVSGADTCHGCRITNKFSLAISSPTKQRYDQ
jgi:hypothetical protein